MFHSLADTRDIVFWTPRGQLLRNKRIIPVTDIADLVEYVLLPHNDDITKPLNRFLDGLAELGVDKCVFKNKKALRDLKEKEKGYRNNENTLENERNVESSSEREEEAEKIATVNGRQAEDILESHNGKETTVRKQKVVALKIPVNIVRTV